MRRDVILARLLFHDLKAYRQHFTSQGLNAIFLKATRIQCVAGLVGTGWPAPSIAIGGGRPGVSYAVILSFYGSVSRPRPYSSTSITCPKMSTIYSTTAPL